MFIRSYKSAFILLFTALLVITVLGVGANAYRRATHVSLALSADIIGEISNRIVTHTHRIFESAFSYLETDALLISGRTSAAARDELMRLFWRQLQLEPQLESLFAASNASRRVPWP